jgi:cytoskeleton protein RodZ
LQVADIAQTLKLGQRQVDALENGEWQSLPGHTFIRGFVRNYARLVHLDPAPLMLQLDTLLERPVNSLALPESKPASMSSSSSGKGRDRAVMLSGGVLVLLALLVYLVLPNDIGVLRDNLQSWVDSLARKEPVVAVPVAVEPVFPPGTTPQQVMNPQAAPAGEGTPAVAGNDVPAVGAVPATTTVQAGVIGKPALRFVADKDSWIEVRDRSDAVIFSQRIAAGAEQLVDGSVPLSLVIGYAPGVKLYWRGQVVDLAPYTKGDIARLVLE